MRYYRLSLAILKRIKSAQNILINVHRNPDLDSFGSALALSCVLNQLGKKTTVISPGPIPKQFLLLDRAKEIKPIDFARFDFSTFDLFLIVDTANASQLTGNGDTPPPEIPTVIIDHHISQLDGMVKLVEEGSASTAEIIAQVLKDWRIKVNSTVATLLFAGVASDSNFFKSVYTTPKTFSVAAELLKAGADKNAITAHFYTYDTGFLKFLGEILARLIVDKDGVCAWAAVDYQAFSKFGKLIEVKDIAADDFLRRAKNTKVGVMFIEESPGTVRVSFRSDNGFDCAALAASVGGGGHKDSAGATVRGVLKEVVAQVLTNAKRQARRE